MAYYTYAKNPIGAFQEREVGNWFEFSANDDTGAFCEDFPHKVWTGGEGICGDRGYRYAHVKKTRGVICIDEDEYGLPVTQKWEIKKHKEYAV